MFLPACTQAKYALATFEITKEKTENCWKAVNSTVVQLCWCNSSETERDGNGVLVSYVFIQAQLIQAQFRPIQKIALSRPVFFETWPFVPFRERENTKETKECYVAKRKTHRPQLHVKILW